MFKPQFCSQTSPPVTIRMEILEFLREQNIAFVEKKDNPPSAPQIRPIENYWGILKMEVYAGNWEASGENKREKLIRRIKQCQKKIDQSQTKPSGGPCRILMSLVSRNCPIPLQKFHSSLITIELFWLKYAISGNSGSLKIQKIQIKAQLLQIYG